MKIISVREDRQYAKIAIKYFQDKWADEDSLMVYDDCITHCIDSSSLLPEWYILYDGNKIIGCAGLVTNDFISRMDLYPWLCALCIEEEYRGNAYPVLLINKAKSDAERIGFSKLYLSTEHIGYYERYGFEYLADGYHLTGDVSRIYFCELKPKINSPF